MHPLYASSSVGLYEPRLRFGGSPVGTKQPSGVEDVDFDISRSFWAVDGVFETKVGITIDRLRRRGVDAGDGGVERGEV